LEKSQSSFSNIVKKGTVQVELRKIILLFGVMILILIGVTILSSKTVWFFVLADKIYNWSHLAQ